MSRISARQQVSAPRYVSKLDWLIAIAIGCALSLGIWHELLTGGGIVGGDTYPYFFPQKQVMADGFSRGELPLWHDRTGLGYPLHAESQAGIFYPTNQLLYRVFTVNTAYNVSILLHYALAFVFAWRFCRSQALSNASALLAAMVFVYGWFPARLSLEWSIIGGVWFPCCLWLTERLISRPGRSAGCLLALAFGTHLLAGHFALAFITQLCCLGYALLTSGREASVQRSGESLKRIHACAIVGGAIAVGILLSAVQLIPTFELRQMSQRDGKSASFDPAYGHMPPVYLSQLVASWWYWHSPEIVQSQKMKEPSLLKSNADTNQVEAHLYVGLIPLGMVLCLLQYPVRQRLRTVHWKAWLILSGAAIVYAFGWFVPVMKHLPGFGFFMGPARYTIVATMGFAIVAGLVLDAILARKSRTMRFVVTALIAMLTLPDLLSSGYAPVCDAQIVPTPPIAGLNDSWIAAEFANKPTARLWAPGQNAGNLFGVSCMPQYLGLGPAEYFDKQKWPQMNVDDSEFPSPTDVERLRELGATHFLAQEAIARLSPDLKLVRAAPDSFWNRAWARGNADCYLYRLKSATGRVVVEPAASLSELTWSEQRPSRHVFRVSLTDDAVVSVNELMFPGWRVTVDGVDMDPATSRGFRRMVRVAAGNHTIAWTYRPGSFLLGLCVSLVVLVMMSVFAFRRRV